MNVPEPRHEHAMAGTETGFFIYGGITNNGNFSSEFWYFDVTQHEWTLISTPYSPPGLAGHTLTVAEDLIYLFGGRNQIGSYQGRLYRMNMTELLDWELVTPYSGKIPSLTGHTTVYHHDSEMLIVFGGFRSHTARFPIRSGYLYGFHLSSQVWIMLSNTEKSGNLFEPTPRAYHTADIMDNYLIIYGGNSPIGRQDNICYDQEMYVYHLTCHKWVDLEIMKQAFTGEIIISENIYICVVNRY